MPVIKINLKKFNFMYTVEMDSIKSILLPLNDMGIPNREENVY